MANKNKPDTNGSQFFICYAPQKSLDNRNTVFGQYDFPSFFLFINLFFFLYMHFSSFSFSIQCMLFSVIDGFDVLDKMERVEVDKKNYRPITEIKILDTGFLFHFLFFPPANQLTFLKQNSLIPVIHANPLAE